MLVSESIERTVFDKLDLGPDRPTALDIDLLLKSRENGFKTHMTLEEEVDIVQRIKTTLELE